MLRVFKGNIFLAGVLAAGGFAHANSARAAIEVLSFEMRQGAAQQASRANAARPFELLTDAEHELPAQILKGQRPVPGRLLDQVWPYSLSQRYLSSYFYVVGPPMGEQFFPVEIADLRRKDEVHFLKQLNRYAGSLLGNPQFNVPSYLRASELTPEDYAPVATDLAKTFGGEPRLWKSAVSQGMHGVKALVNRASATLDQQLKACMDRLEARVARGDAGALRIAQPLWALQRRLEGVAGRRERLEIMHDHLGATASYLDSDAPMRDPESEVIAWDDTEEI